jgi:predicted alpha/beta-hydrolase family hydrolase
MAGSGFETFAREYPEGPAVHGFLHPADGDSGLVLTHGAGGNADSRLLVVLAEALTSQGVSVLRCNMPFRQKRPGGPPHPSGAANDREGLRRAVECLRERVSKVYLGGQSYGGRQATMLASEDLSVTDGLLLISYPLHPPGKPERLRTEHFGELRTPSLFAHGSKDPFGALEEMRTALKLIAGRAELLEVENGGYGLVRGKPEGPYRDTASLVADRFLEFFG